MVVVRRSRTFLCRPAAHDNPIRNKFTRCAVAHVVSRSQSLSHKQHRACPPGTPLQNKVEDVQALLEFLGASPLNDPAIFKRAIARPLRAGATEALTRLALLFKAICLRRGKDVLPASARLPPKVTPMRSQGRFGSSFCGTGLGFCQCRFWL